MSGKAVWEFGFPVPIDQVQEAGTPPLSSHPSVEPVAQQASFQLDIRARRSFGLISILGKA